MNIRKIINVGLMLIVLIFPLYSQSGIELGGYVTAGGNISFPTEGIRDFVEVSSGVGPLGFIRSEGGLNISGGGQVGYYLDLTGDFSGMSFLADLGFGYSTYSSRSIITNLVLSTDFAIVNFTPKFFTFTTGGLIKFHLFKSFSIGLGGGIESFVSDVTATIRTETADLSSNTTTNITLPNPYSFIPYAKVTLEYNAYLTGNLIFRAGLGIKADLTPLLVTVDTEYLPLAVNANVIFGVSYLFRIYPR
jgi:hypothetical protein